MVDGIGKDNTASLRTTCFPSAPSKSGFVYEKTSPLVKKEEPKQVVEEEKKPPVEKALPVPEPATKSPVAQAGLTVDSLFTSLAKKVLVESKEKAPPFADVLKQAYATKNLGLESATEVLTFDEYMERVHKNPALAGMVISQYITSAIDYVERTYGSGDEPKTTRSLGEYLKDFYFLDPVFQKEQLHVEEIFRGQRRFWNEFYDVLKEFSVKPRPNRAVIIHGPHATGKTNSVEDLLYKLIMFYSRTKEGAVYTFNTVFDDKAPHFGFQKESVTDKPIMSQDVVFELPADSNSSPFLLLGIDQRKQFLDSLQEEGKLSPGFNTEYTLHFPLDPLSKNLFLGLIALYQGDRKESDLTSEEKAEINRRALRHIQVLPLLFSSEEARGLVTKRARPLPEDASFPIASKADLSRLAVPYQVILESVNIATTRGPHFDASRGLVFLDEFFASCNELSDHKAREVLHLLDLVEKGKATVESNGRGEACRYYDVRIPVLLLFVDNDDAVRKYAVEHPANFDKLASRAVFLTQERERDYREVKAILRDNFTIEPGRQISPYLFETIGKFLVMSSLLPAVNTAYYKSDDIRGFTKEEKEIISHFLTDSKGGLTLLDKANLYAGSLERLPQEYKTLLERATKYIRDEYNRGVEERQFSFYEGKFGLDPRKGENILRKAKLRKPDECFSVLELLDELEEQRVQGFGFENDWAAIKDAAEKSKGKSGEGTLQLPTNFPTPKQMIGSLREELKERIRDDVMDALGVLKLESEIKKDLQKYIAHVRAYVTSEDVAPQYRSRGSVKPEKPDLTFMEEIEKIIFPETPSTRIDDVRKREILVKLGAKTPAGVNAMDQIDEIFPDFMKRLKEHYEKALNTKEKISNFRDDLEACHKNNGVLNTVEILKSDKKRRELFIRGLEGLREKGYCKDCVVKVVAFALNDWEFLK